VPDTTKPITVLLVDDQQLMRDGIKMLLELEQGIELVGEASDGQQAVTRYNELNPDLVLMDVEMPGTNGIQATQKIRSLDPSARILILTTFGQEDYLHDALLAGAQGFLLKAVSGETLAQDIRKAHQGEPVFDTQSTELLLRSYRSLSDTQTAKPNHLLNVRELQILNLISQRHNNREIAFKLELAEGTVKNYISQILEKLNVRDRNQAVVIAKEKGVID